MAKRSAGILMYRQGNGYVEVLLVHPGGPFWAKKDEGAWSIPKGEYADDEDALAAAKREFAEELGTEVDGEFAELGEVKQASGKIVTAWAVKGDLDATAIRSNMFEVEWPPRSGTMRTFPEVDRAEWFRLPDARVKILGAQSALLNRLERKISGEDGK